MKFTDDARWLVDRFISDDETRFIVDRIMALPDAIQRDPDAVEIAYCRIIIEALRTRTPSRTMSQRAADLLERLLRSKKQRKRDDAAAFLQHVSELTDHQAEPDNKDAVDAGIIDPRDVRHKTRNKARQEVAKHFHLSVKGLRQKRKRARRHLRRTD